MLLCKALVTSVIPMVILYVAAMTTIIRVVCAGSTGE